MRFWLRAVWGAAIVLLGALSSTSVGGAADTVVRMGSTTGASGQEVTVRLETVSVADPGLGAFTIDVGYNPDVVSPISCKGDPAKALDTVVCNPAYKTGNVRVGGYRMTDGLTGDTPLADITFRLSGDEGDCSDLTINISELTDPSTKSLSSRTENGTLCIGDASSASSTPGSGSKTTPAATSEPGQNTGTAGPNGQQPGSTVAPGETGGSVEPGQTPSSSSSGAATASTSQGGENGGATAKTTPGAASGTGGTKTQTSGESSSGGGAKSWLIGIGVAIAAALVAGAGVVAWKRRASPRL